MPKNKPKFINVSSIDFIQLGHDLNAALAQGEAQFNAYLEAKGLGQRKAYYLMSVLKAFDTLPVKKDRLLAIGWTKLSIIAPVVNPENWDYWLVQAENLNAVELKELVKGKTPYLHKHCVMYYLTPDEFELLATVSEQFGAVREGRTIHGKEAALMDALLQVLDWS